MSVDINFIQVMRMNVPSPMQCKSSLYTFVTAFLTLVMLSFSIEAQELPLSPYIWHISEEFPQPSLFECPLQEVEVQADDFPSPLQVNEEITVKESDPLLRNRKTLRHEVFVSLLRPDSNTVKQIKIIDFKTQDSELSTQGLTSTQDSGLRTQNSIELGVGLVEQDLAKSNEPEDRQEKNTPLFYEEQWLAIATPVEPSLDPYENWETKWEPEETLSIATAEETPPDDPYLNETPMLNEEYSRGVENSEIGVADDSIGKIDEEIMEEKAEIPSGFSGQWVAVTPPAQPLSGIHDQELKEEPKIIPYDWSQVTAKSFVSASQEKIEKPIHIGSQERVENPTPIPDEEKKRTGLSGPRIPEEKSVGPLAATLGTSLNKDKRSSQNNGEAKVKVSEKKILLTSEILAMNNPEETAEIQIPITHHRISDSDGEISAIQGPGVSEDPFKTQIYTPGKETAPAPTTKGDYNPVVPPVVRPGTPVPSTPGVTRPIPPQQPTGRPPVPEAPTPAPTPPAVPVLETPPSPNEGFLINFNNVGMVEYLSFISKITGKNFVFDEADLDFRVTIISNEPTSLDNVMAALLQELRIHGLSLMEIGNNLVIHRNPKANSPGTVVTEGRVPPKVNLVTEVFKISNTDPEKMAAIVRPLVSDLAIVEFIELTGHLIVTDIATNLERVRKLISSLDAPSTGFEIGQYRVKYATAETAIVLAERILAPIAQGKTLTFVPHAATNSIYIISSPFLVSRAIAVLERLDVPEGQGTTRILSLENLGLQKSLEERAIEQALGGAGRVPGGPLGPGGGIGRGGKWTSELSLGHVESTKFYIHKLQYRKGEQIEAALKKIGESLQLGGSRIAGAPLALQTTDLITSINSVQWIEASNSLVYTGTSESIAKVTELIEEIDVSARQVLIDVLILDTTIQDSLSFGVEFGARFSEPNAAGAEAFLATPQSPLPLALDNTAPGITARGTPISAAGIGRVTGFNIGAIGRRVSRDGTFFSSIGAIVNALHQDQRINIIMNPKIVVEDNTPASIFVGQNIPFQTQSIANDIGTIITSTVDYRDVGATLKVTPLIGSNDVITLEIEQEVSTLATNVPGLTIGSNVAAASSIASTLNGIFPVTNKNKTVTKIHVPNEYFVILSGMMQDSDTKTNSQIPCLGGVPILGGGFRQYNNTDQKRNIMLFLRIQIIERPNMDAITKREQDIYIEKDRIRRRWEYEVDQALDYFNLKDVCNPQIPQHNEEW